MTRRERERSRSRIRTRTVIVVLIASGVTLSFLGALIVPLYTYPGVSWSAIISAKEANPSVGMVVIINPDNGPGTSRDQNYVTGINNLRAAGVVVLGYDHTSWAGRPMADVKADIDSYKGWYNISGIFFDEMSNVPGDEGYYSTLNQYSKSLGLNFTVGNPGGPAPASYLGTLDVIVTYENQGLPDSTSLAAMTNGMPANHFAVIAYGVDVWNGSAVNDIYKYASYVYVTNDTLPNPYGALSGDFSNMVSYLSDPVPASVPLTVRTVDAGGTPIAGVYTVITSTNGTTVASGNTPLTAPVNRGAGYVVSVANYGNFVFSHWEDGSTSPTQGVTVTGSTTVTATYGMRAPTTASMTIQSFALNDASIPGLSTTVTSNGGFVATGVTPFTFVGTIGTSYTVSIGNSSSYVFDDWSGGNRSQVQTVTLTQSMTLTAYFTMAVQAPSTNSTSTNSTSSTSSTASSSTTTTSSTTSTTSSTTSTSSSTTSTSSSTTSSSTTSSTTSTTSTSSSTTSSTTSSATISSTSSASTSSTTIATTPTVSAGSSTAASSSSTTAASSVTISKSQSTSAFTTRLPAVPASTILLGIGAFVVVAAAVAGGTVLMRKKG